MFCDMTGKVAIVTGAAQGLGAAEASVLLEHGGGRARRRHPTRRAEHSSPSAMPAGFAGRIAYRSLDVTRMDNWRAAVEADGASENSRR